MGSERAVIDIGSNTLRLVIFDGPPRAPRVVVNEKVTARLGKGVYDTGAISPKARQSALAALRRYALLLEAREAGHVDVVATAAVRDATNGPQFLEAVAQIGLAPRLLSGVEEALTGAQGVIGAFPGAKGVVADLGGGSLELVHVAAGQGDHGTSLPFGSLRLPAMRELGADRFNRGLRKAITRSGFECAPGETLFLVGGSHRALAQYAMHRDHFPLDDPHGYTLERKDAASLCRSLRIGHPAAPVPGLSATRAASLPYTAALLAELIRTIDPARVIFSSWGLREGLHFASLAPDIRRQSPLIAGVADFAASQGVSYALAEAVARWTASADIPAGSRQEDLRLAAVTLALASQRIEPNLRPDTVVSWALRKRWIGLSAAGRAMIAACGLAHCGAEPLRPELLRLATPAELRRAAIWGNAVRLCRRLGAGASRPLAQAALRVDAAMAELAIDDSIAGLVNDGVERDLRSLAQRLGLTARVTIVPLVAGGDRAPA